MAPDYKIVLLLLNHNNLIIFINKVKQKIVNRQSLCILVCIQSLLYTSMTFSSQDSEGDKFCQY